MTTVKANQDIPPDPTPSSDLDKQLASMIRNSRWIVIVLFVISLLALGASLFMVANQAATQRNIIAQTQRAVVKEVANECDFFRDIGDAPASPQQTELGTKILVDSRNIFIGLKCDGKLNEPSKQLLDLVAKYHLNLKG